MSYTLKIKEPKGVLANPKRESLSVPRIDTLAGKTVAFICVHANGQKQLASSNFFEALGRKMQEVYPDVKIVYYPSFGAPKFPDTSKEIADHCDCWVEGVKDAISQGLRDVGTFMERAGRPGVSLATDVLVPPKKALADLNGCPKARVVGLPAVEFCLAKRDPELMKGVVEKAFDEIVHALTDPLTEEEKNVPDMTYDYSDKEFVGENSAEAYEKFMQYCEANALTDGLSVNAPTPEAVDWMLTGTSYPRDKVIGTMYPKSGIATVEKIAICAVMAGARPEWLPVIITIIEVFTAKDFNQFHMVNEIMPAIFVSGPIVDELKMNNKVGYLSPGYRVNATISRTLLLCEIAIGWRDMTMYSSPGGPGSPQAYANYLFPENQAESPWPSWSEANGYSPEESTVTICEMAGTVRGPGEIMSNADVNERINMIINAFSMNSSGMFASFGMPKDGSNNRHMIVLHPTMAHQLNNAGYTRESLVKTIYDRNVIDWDLMTEEEREALKRDLADGVKAKKMFSVSVDDVKPGLHREPFHEMSDVLVFVTGSGAGNSMIFQTPCGSTADVEDVYNFRPFMIKTIHGATLTKYGK